MAANSTATPTRRGKEFLPRVPDTADVRNHAAQFQRPRRARSRFQHVHQAQHPIRAQLDARLIMTEPHKEPRAFTQELRREEVAPMRRLPRNDRAVQPIPFARFRHNPIQISRLNGLGHESMCYFLVGDSSVLTFGDHQACKLPPSKHLYRLWHSMFAYRTNLIFHFRTNPSLFRDCVRKVGVRAEARPRRCKRAWPSPRQYVEQSEPHPMKLWPSRRQRGLGFG